MGVELSNFKNLDFSKARTGVINTLESIICFGAMFCSIKLVFSFGSPRKIFKKAMSGNAINVAAIMVRRGWPNEGKQNKPMDFHGKNFSIFAKAYNRIPLFVQLGFQDSLWCYVYGAIEFTVGSNSSHIRNFISREARDGFENLRKRGKVLVSHWVSLLIKGTSGLEPYPCDNRGAACLFIPQAYGICNG